MCPMKQPNLKNKIKFNNNNKNPSRNKTRGKTKPKKPLRSIKVQDVAKEANPCMCEKGREVAVIERKGAKGDKINCDYPLESRHLTALSDS